MRIPKEANDSVRVTVEPVAALATIATDLCRVQMWCRSQELVYTRIARRFSVIQNRLCRSGHYREKSDTLVTECGADRRRVKGPNAVIVN